MRTDYKINLMKGFVNLYSLSPNHKYYYRIKKPWEVAMGVYAAPLAFFSVEDSLIYCTPINRDPSYLPPFESFKNVEWLDDGGYAFFIEYERNNSDLCVLSLDEKICYKRKMVLGEEIEDVLKQFIPSKNIIDLLSELQFLKYQISDTDNIDNFRENIFNVWYPR
jgi:hypothetical protein